MYGRHVGIVTERGLVSKWKDQHLHIFYDNHPLNVYNISDHL